MIRGIGIHIRFIESLQDLIERARALEVPFFQSFLVVKTTGMIVRPTMEERNQFLAARRQHFQQLYVHGSYWINLASLLHAHHRALSRELAVAKKLEFNHIVLHPGSAKGGKSKADGIDALARTLNDVLKYEHDIKIILENTAHGALSVGGDIQDFVRLMGKLDHPEKIRFCIDTAHAYSYGYDIVDDLRREAFIQLLDSTIGSGNIALLHVNDTREKLGSKMDRHEAIGKGRIGETALKAFCMHPKLASIPLLLELPVLSLEQEVEMLAMVRGWHEEKLV